MRYNITNQNGVPDEITRWATHSNGIRRHFESTALIEAPIEAVFAYLDDPRRLSSHMSKSSWMMGGGRMEIKLDAARGRSVGSSIRLTGTVFGMHLSVEETVMERNPPRHKAWETVGNPKLLVIGHYRMGFTLETQSDGSLVKVYIDYAMPPKWPAGWLGYLFGWHYARWCTQRMLRDGVTYFHRRNSVPRSESVNND